MSVSLGVSPGRIRYDNMLKDGYAETTVVLSTNLPGEMLGHFYVEGELKDWISFGQNYTNFSISVDNPLPLKVVAKTPPDARSDVYTGKIVFVTDRYGEVSSRAGGFVSAAINLPLSIIVSDLEIRSCSAGAFRFADVEIDYPLELSFTVENNGNVRLRPKVEVNIWDQLQDDLVLDHTLLSEEVLPTVTKQISKKISKKQLPPGQYWAKVSIDECGASDLVTFSVVEKGAIVDKGTLDVISNKAWAYTNETVPIVATFTNKGPRTVTAKFVGKIMLKNKIVQLIDTDEVEIPSGEVGNIETYFTPMKPGMYTISGRVRYNKKLTYEKTSILNVNRAPETVESNSMRMFLLLIYLIIISIIIFLVKRIIHEKRNKF